MQIRPPEPRAFHTHIHQAVNELSKQHFPDQRPANPEAWRAFTIRSHEDGTTTLRIIATDREDGPAHLTITRMPDQQIQCRNHEGKDTELPFQPAHQHILLPFLTWATQAIAAHVAQQTPREDFLLYAADNAHRVEAAAQELAQRNLSHCKIDGHIRRLQASNLVRRVTRTIRDRLAEPDMREDVRDLVFQHHHPSLFCPCGTLGMHNNVVRNRHVLRQLKQTDPWTLNYYNHIVAQERHRQDDTFTEPAQITQLVQRHLGVTDRQFTFRYYGGNPKGARLPEDHSQGQRNNILHYRSASRLRTDAVLNLIVLNRLLSSPDEPSKAGPTPSFTHMGVTALTGQRHNEEHYQNLCHVAQRIAPHMDHSQQVRTIERFHQRVTRHSKETPTPEEFIASLNLSRPE